MQPTKCNTATLHCYGRVDVKRVTRLCSAREPERWCRKRACKRSCSGVMLCLQTLTGFGMLEGAVGAVWTGITGRHDVMCVFFPFF